MKKRGRPPGPGKKNAAVEERIAYVLTLLAMRLTPGEIKKVVRAKFDAELDHCTVFRYIAKARILARNNIQKTTEDYVAEAYNTYSEIIKVSWGNPSIAIKAQEAIDKLMGTNGSQVREKNDAAETERRRQLATDPAQLRNQLVKLVAELQAQLNNMQNTGDDRGVSGEQPTA